MDTTASVLGTATTGFNATVGTLTGDRPQQIGRLADTLGIGDFRLPRPIVDLTDELSAIGACADYVAAQTEYRLSLHDDEPVAQYARRLLSSPFQCPFSRTCVAISG